MGRKWQGGDGARVQVRVNAAERKTWQRLADTAAGERGAALGAWIRAMVRRAIGDAP